MDAAAVRFVVAFAMTGIRFLLGLVFLLASVPKLLAPREFRAAVGNYGLVPARGVGLIAALIPLLELLCAAALLLGAGLPLVAACAAFLLTLFNGAVAINLVRGKKFDCGCSGLVAPRRISWALVLRNSLLIGLATCLALRPSRGSSIAVVPWPTHGTPPLPTQSVGAVASAVGLGVMILSLAINAVRLHSAARRLAYRGDTS